MRKPRPLGVVALLGLGASVLTKTLTFALDFETFKLLREEKGESFFTFARDMTVRSTKAMIQTVSIPEGLGPWRSKLLWAALVLPMPLDGLLIIGGVCADTGSQESEQYACETAEEINIADLAVEEGTSALKDFIPYNGVLK